MGKKYLSQLSIRAVEFFSASSAGKKHLTQNYLPRRVHILFILAVLIAACSTQAYEEIPIGKSSFTFNEYEPLKDKSLQVFTYRPKGDVTVMPILFVIHGTLRNANTYRDNWVELADKHGVLIIAPEFSRDDFPGSRGYNLGGMFDADGNLVEEQYWAYSLIEPIFDEIQERTKTQQETYDIFGHSAGAQFTHRLFLFKENLKANRVISSNAGWYTMPDFEIDFPYGLKNTSLNEESLKHRIENKMLIHLGEEDNDPNHRYLRTSAEAMRQGKHRFERGHTFLEEAEKMSEKYGVDLQWFIKTVPGVGHNNAKMAVDVAEYLYETK